MKEIFSRLIILATIISLSACSQTNDEQIKTYQTNIDQIYIYHSAFGQRYPEYKISFKDKTFWEYRSDYKNYKERNSSLKNEGFKFVNDLENDKIETFILESSRYGFTLWNESYINENILDGHQWGITISFSDSTQRSMYGSNEYPETWDKMLEAFESLTGENILIYKSDWNN